ncbi:hypothetical protein RRG08_004812 [Elysia crispata]|uniref:Uncharacterized protein n=1 Tax=Elysia crispata TaxID=231223 RepID=A0AAE0Y5C1_9GAST|nr:hypothetical protein RRG08_004812 [Elysia crispata]
MGVSGSSGRRTRTSGGSANRIKRGACRHRPGTLIGWLPKCPQIDLPWEREKFRLHTDCLRTVSLRIKIWLVSGFNSAVNGSDSIFSVETVCFPLHSKPVVY